MRTLSTLSCVMALFLAPSLRAQTTTPSLEPEPPALKRVVAIENVCAWPNLTLLADGSIAAVEAGTRKVELKPLAPAKGHMNTVEQVNFEEAGR